MNCSTFAALAFSGLKAAAGFQRTPLLATIIITDRCNLSCRHCAVANQGGKLSTYTETLTLMHKLVNKGVKILFFCGGEVFLWRDEGYTIHHLVRKAKEMGFALVCVVTNGTISIEVPEADLVFLSIDGMEKTHNAIRGNTFQLILSNLEKVSKPNIIFYMAVNNINYRDIPEVTGLAAENHRVKAISFNFHTPYKGTEGLALDHKQKVQAAASIKSLFRKGAPVFNLPVGLDYYLNGNWSRPCHQCVVYENGKAFTCGRCSEIPGLCRKCGYLFAVEFSLLLKGNLRAIRQMLATYLKYC
ncbi:pyruvate-formate lyase-activating enzyme [Desulfocucumis palustris]|uniref:Pyruvate-formate lyase-activating enzyme n=1 Tax=Desulfocucumis palustris TaxID=1898651 RepID=A0A2L2XA78_9FIRM|nr:radical SAM protein [Desulfocucumis palustris]GBF32952.1 pyruvate-formate lyase-activating enzyme [Desulfocucumis palustris]